MIKLESEEDTKSFAEKLAKNASAGDCFALHGDLGAGKSTFSRYFIKSLCPHVDDVPSPTFTIVQQYAHGTYDILHIDCYRLESDEDALEIGITELLPHSISLIEWPERIPNLLPKNAMHIYFHILGSERNVEIR